MFSSLKGKIAFSGFAVLVIGITLLLFTFFSAYGFLTAGISPISTQDLIQTFGEALGPLIAAAIQIMFLGVMGWIGSLITLRGVAIIGIKKNPPIIQQKSAIKEINQPQTKQEQQINDPEMIVMPLEQIEQKSQSRKKNKRSK